MRCARALVENGGHCILDYLLAHFCEGDEILDAQLGLPHTLLNDLNLAAMPYYQVFSHPLGLDKAIFDCGTALLTVTDNNRTNDSKHTGSALLRSDFYFDKYRKC